MLEENKTLVLRYYNEVLNEGKIAVIDEIVSPEIECALWSEAEPRYGAEACKQELTNMRAALPDWHVELRELVAQGTTVVGQWVASGTHTGEPLQLITGIFPATGKKFQMIGMHWFRIVHGKIVQIKSNEDTIGMLTQLDALPKTNAHQTAPVITNETTILRYFTEFMSQGKLEVAEEIATADFMLHIPTIPEPIRGIEGLKQFAVRLRSGLPDVRFTINRQVVEGDTIAVSWNLSGTHSGEFLGIPPTGKLVKDEGTDIFHMVDTKITEIWILENGLSFMQQLGAISLPD